MRMRGGALWLAVALGTVLLSLPSTHATTSPIVQVGIVQDGPLGDRGHPLIEPLIAEVSAKRLPAYNIASPAGSPEVYRYA